MDCLKSLKQTRYGGMCFCVQSSVYNEYLSFQSVQPQFQLKLSIFYQHTGQQSYQISQTHTAHISNDVPIIVIA